MALISMAVYDTVENKRTEYTKRTLESLVATVDFNRHHLGISDNNSCDATQRLYEWFYDLWKFYHGNLHFIKNSENLGTAEAINKCWQNRRLNENAIKIDNDVVIHGAGWVDEMEAAIKRDETIGLVGLKRKDLEQWPGHPEKQYASKLTMLPHERGERWLVVEECADIMGTCVMHSAKLLDAVGYLYQPAKYGFDDVLMSIRSRKAGFKNVFIPHIEIDHIDIGGDAYCDWKKKHSGEQWDEIGRLAQGYENGAIPVFYSPFI